MKYYGVKISRNNRELLEIVDANSEKEARRYFAVKYMDIALSCTMMLDVLKKSEYEKLMVA